jgi:hypothetical protein
MRRLRRPKWLVIDGCPAPYDVAPYIYLILRRAGQSASSIYRGDDPAARPILHRHGKHTQREMENASPAQRAEWGITGTPNPAGRSMHELRSDGVAKRGPVGRHLEEWEVGVDSGVNNDITRQQLRRAAQHYGLEIYFPYDSVVEYHHWGFHRQPRADGKHLTRTRVALTRAYLRRFK